MTPTNKLFVRVEKDKDDGTFLAFVVNPDDVHEDLNNCLGFGTDEKLAIENLDFEIGLILSRIAENEPITPWVLVKEGE